MFLSYINDLTDDLESCPFIFADDTTLFEVVNNPTDFGQLSNDDLTKISRLLVTMNPLKNPTYDFFEKERKAKSGCDIFIPTLALLFKIICHGIVIHFQSMKRFMKVIKV